MDNPPTQTPDEKASDQETRLHAADKIELKVWLRLLTCSNMMEHQVRDGLRRVFHTTLPQFDVLAQLERVDPEDGLTMGELSARLMVSPGNLTGLVERLNKDGLVERQAMPEDRRRFRVRLTEAGRAHFLNMTPDNEAWVEALFDGLSRAELDDLYRLLGAMKRSITSALPLASDQANQDPGE